MLKALTLYRPWPILLHGAVRRQSDRYVLTPGPKAPENRGWHPPRELIGSFMALHSGKAFDSAQYSMTKEFGLGITFPGPEMAITGVAFLDRSFGHCQRSLVRGLWCLRCTSGAGDPLGRDRFYTGSVAWVFTGRVPLLEPVPCKGAQGVWTVPPAIEKEVKRQYERSIRELEGQLPTGPRWWP